jgi:hypothetical protein
VNTGTQHLHRWSFNHRPAGFLSNNSQETRKFRKTSLSRAKLTTSGEDAAENIMAATSACGPAKRIPMQQRDPIMLLIVTPLNVRLIRFSEAFLPDCRTSPKLQ